MKIKLFITILTIFYCSVSSAKDNFVLNAEFVRELKTFLSKYPVISKTKSIILVQLTYKDKERSIVTVRFRSNDEFIDLFRYCNPNDTYLFAGKIKRKNIIVSFRSEMGKIINTELSCANFFGNGKVKKQLRLMNKLKGTKAYDNQFEGMRIVHFSPEMSLHYIKGVIVKVEYRDETTENNGLMKSMKKGGLKLVY